jgi:hypothetical protein
MKTNRRRTSGTPDGHDAALREHVSAQSSRARLVLGVAVGVGGGVLAVGASPWSAQSAIAVSAPGEGTDVSPSGLTLKSSSTVRILAGRETDFWLEGPNAESVTKATFEFVGADRAPVQLESDRAGTAADPAVTYTFEAVGPDLPVRVTIERDGDSEVLETTVEVIAVNTVNEEVEPPTPGVGNAGGSPANEGNGELPAVPEGADVSSTGSSPSTAPGANGQADGTDDDEPDSTDTTGPDDTSTEVPGSDSDGGTVTDAEGDLGAVVIPASEGPPITAEEYVNALYEDGVIDAATRDRFLGDPALLDELQKILDAGGGTFVLPSAGAQNIADIRGKSDEELGEILAAPFSFEDGPSPAQIVAIDVLAGGDFNKFREMFTNYVLSRVPGLGLQVYEYGYAEGFFFTMNGRIIRSADLPPWLAQLASQLGNESDEGGIGEIDGAAYDAVTDDDPATNVIDLLPDEDYGEGYHLEWDYTDEGLRSRTDPLLDVTPEVWDRDGIDEMMQIDHGTGSHAAGQLNVADPSWLEGSIVFSVNDPGAQIDLDIGDNIVVNAYSDRSNIDVGFGNPNVFVTGSDDLSFTVDGGQPVFRFAGSDPITGTVGRDRGKTWATVENATRLEGYDFEFGAGGPETLVNEESGELINGRFVAEGEADAIINAGYSAGNRNLLGDDQDVVVNTETSASLSNEYDLGDDGDFIENLGFNDQDRVVFGDGSDRAEHGEDQAGNVTYEDSERSYFNEGQREDENGNELKFEHDRVVVRSREEEGYLVDRGDGKWVRVDAEGNELGTVTIAGDQDDIEQISGRNADGTYGSLKYLEPDKKQDGFFTKLWNGAVNFFFSEVTAKTTYDGEDLTFSADTESGGSIEFGSVTVNENDANSNEPKYSFDSDVRYNEFERPDDVKSEVSIRNDEGVLIASGEFGGAVGPRATPNDALQVIQNQLGIDRKTALNYADQTMYRATDANVENANSIARGLGYAGIKDLAAQYTLNPGGNAQRQEEVDIPGRNEQPTTDAEFKSYFNGLDNLGDLQLTVSNGLFIRPPSPGLNTTDDIDSGDDLPAEQRDRAASFDQFASATQAAEIFRNGLIGVARDGLLGLGIGGATGAEAAEQQYDRFMSGRGGFYENKVNSLLSDVATNSVPGQAFSARVGTKALDAVRDSIDLDAQAVDGDGLVRLDAADLAKVKVPLASEDTFNASASSIFHAPDPLALIGGSQGASVRLTGATYDPATGAVKVEYVSKVYDVFGVDYGDISIPNVGFDFIDSLTRNSVTALDALYRLQHGPTDDLDGPRPKPFLNVTEIPGQANALVKE